ncbi:MAG: YqaJ viral recombinase family protein [Deltaproteobacteria bacterium]|nr:YqaJ viral recombinase family protein [Deltaproteobacteria bacterium]
MAKFKPWEYAGKNTICVQGEPTSNPKKITGTRLGAVLGLNKWKSEFGAWCEICRVAEEPFEGNKYTEAGIAIEPKLIEWCKENVSPYIYTPEEWFKSKTKLYDHFPSEPIFGGMWDGIILDDVLGKGEPIGVIEGKTSSRPQDWVDGVPPTYAAQGLEYAQLLGVDRVFFPVRFMEPDEYDHPEKCECTSDNTHLYDIHVSDTDIEADLRRAELWHKKHVAGNVSPKFNEKRDKVFLDILRKSEVKDTDLEELAKEVATIETKIEKILSKSELTDLEKQLKKLKGKMKPAMVKLFGKNDTAITAYGWQMKKSSRSEVDKEALRKDNLLDKYSKVSDTYRLSKEKTND